MVLDMYKKKENRKKIDLAFNSKSPLEKIIIYESRLDEKIAQYISRLDAEIEPEESFYESSQVLLTEYKKNLKQLENYNSPIIPTKYKFFENQVWLGLAKYRQTNLKNDTREKNKYK